MVFQPKPSFSSEKFVFSMKKVCLFLAQTHIFPRQKLAFPTKTNCFLRKTRKTQKPSFENLCGQTAKINFFLLSLGISWFSCPRPSFQPKTIFSNQLFGPKTLGDKLFVCTENHLFSGKKLFFFPPKTILFLGITKTTSFFRVWPYRFPK